MKPILVAMLLFLAGCSGHSPDILDEKYTQSRRLTPLFEQGRCRIDTVSLNYIVLADVRNDISGGSSVGKTFRELLVQGLTLSSAESAQASTHRVGSGR